MFSAVKNIENSEYARFGRYLHEQHFAAVFLVAFMLHAMGVAIYYLMPPAPIEEIPVRVLNVKLGGGTNAAAITSDDINRLFAKRRLAEKQPEPVAAAPKPEPEPAKPVVEKRPEPEPPKPEPVKQEKKPEPKPEPKKIEPPKQEVARAALETPKPKAEITPPPPKPEPVKVVEKKEPSKPKPEPSLERRVITQPLTRQPVKPKRYVRGSQLTAQVKPSSSNKIIKGAGSTLGNSTAQNAEIQRRYTQTISLWIDKHKVYPEAARARGEGGKVILRIRINRQGRILRFLLEKSSGSEAIDRAITQMIDAANPLPAVPADYPDTKPYLEFLIPINFIP